MNEKVFSAKARDLLLFQNTFVAIHVKMDGIELHLIHTLTYTFYGIVVRVSALFYV